MLAAMIVFLAILFWTGYWLLLKGQLPLSDRALMLVGTLLMTISILVPFLIVIKLLVSTFFLNFLAYEFSLLGMMFFVFGLGGLGRYRAPSLTDSDLAKYHKAYGD